MSVNIQHMMIYVKNERGVAMPLYVKKTEHVESIWSEVTASHVITNRVLRGKALYHKGRRLMVTDLIGDVGISHYDFVVLRNIKDEEASSHVHLQHQISEPNDIKHIETIRKDSMPSINS